MSQPSQPLPDAGTLQEAASAFAEFERHYRALFNNRTHAVVHCRVITDAGGRPVDYRFEKINDTYAQLLGTTRAETEGRLLSEVFPEAVHDSFDYIGTFGRIGLEGGEGTFEVSNTVTGRFFRIFAYSHRPGWFTLVIADITAQTGVEFALLESERLYSALFHNATQGIAQCRVVCDECGEPVDFVLEAVNETACRILELTREQLEGRPVTEVFPGQDRNAFDFIRELGQASMEGRETTFEFEIGALGKWLSIYACSPARGEFTALFSDITAQKRAELALCESEALSRATFEQAAVGMAHVTPAGDWVRVNRKYCEMLGYREDELIGRNFRDFTHPEDRALRDPELAQIREGRPGTFTVEKRYLHRSGRIVWARVTVTTVRDSDGEVKYSFVVAEDITEGKQSAAMQEGLFRQAAVGMAVVSLNGRVLRANARLAAITGYSVDELCGLDFRAITYPEDLPGNVEMQCRMLEGHISEYTLEKRYVRKDGQPVWCLISVSLVRDETGSAPYIVVIVKDIQARKRLEAEVEQARLDLEQRVQERTRELQLAKQQAEEALRAAEAASQAKTEFLAIMSHEIRTPLNGVIGFNGLLLDGPLTEEKRPYAELARQSGESLLHLLNDFLDFSKIESGHLEFELTDFSLDEEINLVLSLVRDSAVRKQLALSSRFEAPARLRGDAARLRQVLLNLLSNAVKFTERGQITLSCDELTRDGHTSWICFEVTDTGIGIEPAVRPRLFQPFVQGDVSTTRRFGGTGLGLAICKRLVEAMGGKIGLRSTPGKGSTFWFELPFIRCAVPGQAAALPEAGAGECRGRVLVVEDNPVSQLLATAMLKRMGCQADVVGNGQEAVEAWRRLPYDLILMDCDMPVMDGLDATRAIRAAERPGQRIPIIAITASALAGDSDRCREAGMDDFLAKPVRQQELSQKVLTWLKVVVA